MNIGVATIQKRKPSKMGRKSPTVYRMAITAQAKKISIPMA
jgi:hypothetical protein